MEALAGVCADAVDRKDDKDAPTTWDFVVLIDELLSAMEVAGRKVEVDMSKKGSSSRR